MKKLKFLLIAILILSLSLSIISCGDDDKKDSISDFYDTVTASQVLLDDLAGDIYTNWYNAIYKDYYYGNINLAIEAALNEHEENIETIKTNDAMIAELYKEIKDHELKAEIKEVLDAYTEYYEFVVNVSGSFDTYSSQKENLKKNLATALRSLNYEL